MKTFHIDGASFIQTTGNPESRGTSSEDGFVLVKSDDVMQFYEDLARFNPKEIMEIGMYEGGSLVWYDKIYQPSKLVGLDVRRTPIDALENYKATRPYIETYYGRYQEKPGTLNAARKNFPSGVDLIVDDASHLYEQTKATFSMLFPLVKKGGHYIIEDWAWSHRPAYQEINSVWANQKALSDLIIELSIMATQNKVISEIRITNGLVCVTKGPGVFSDELFNLSSCLRGKELPNL